MALSDCGVKTDRTERELKRHGTTDFPVACYRDDLSANEVPWHWHDELEIGVVVSGSSVVSTGTETIAVSAGEGFFVNAGVLHACADSGTGEKCVIHSLVFSPSLVGGSPDSIYWKKYLTPILRSPALRSYHFKQATAWERDAIALISDAWMTCAQELGLFEISVRDTLSRLSAILAERLPGDGEEMSVLDARNEERIKRMLHHIEEYYGENIATRDIAASAAVSDSECLRCFKHVLGTTPIKYLVAYRLRKASDLLATTDLRVSEVADRCGFRDMSYFSKAFREAYGTTPSAYASDRRGTKW